MGSCAGSHVGGPDDATQGDGIVHLLNLLELEIERLSREVEEKRKVYFLL